MAELNDYQKGFIEFLVKNEVLTFGDFTLKSGRKCPYFLNFGKIFTSSALLELGTFYAVGLSIFSPAKFDVIFGPAYKGIPICVAAAIAFNQHAVTLGLEGKGNIQYCFNRKEAKDHGEGGSLIGAPVNGNTRIIILDDVITAGTAMRQTLDLLKKEGNPQISGIIVAVDRMEKGLGQTSALQDLSNQGIKVFSLVNVKHIMQYLSRNEVDGKIILDRQRLEKMDNYLREYGVDQENLLA